MKKFIALLLALVMLAAAGLACAETFEIEVGTPSSCSPEMFKMYFQLMENQAGYTFVWKDEVDTEGDYSIYSGQSEDGMMTINIYATNGGVAYAEGVGSLTANFSDSASATKFGEWFGAAVGGMSFGFYVGENGTSSVDATLTNTFTNDLMSLVNDMTAALDDEEKLKEGVVVTANVLGYPTALEIRGAQDGLSISLEMKIAVTSADSQIIVK